MKSLLEEKKDWTKKEVMNAAKKIFFQKGYPNTSIEEIAQAARVSKGTIYLYFKSKDELYLSLMFPTLEELGRRFKDLEGKLTDGQLMNSKAIVMGFFEIFKKLYEDDPDGIRIIQAFQQGGLVSKMTGETGGEIDRYAKRNFSIARNIISKAIKLDLIGKVNPAKIIDIFWGAFIGIVQLEESKLRATQKDHIFSTLEYAFLSMADHLCPGKKRS